MFETNGYYFIELGDTVKIIDVDVSYYNKSPLRYRKGFYCENENEKCLDLPIQLMFDKKLNICCPCRILLEERLDKKRLLHNGIKYNRILLEERLDKKRLLHNVKYNRRWY